MLAGQHERHLACKKTTATTTPKFLHLGTNQTCSNFGYIGQLKKQEAQLPLRYRASEMRFFVAKLLSIGNFGMS